MRRSRRSLTSLAAAGVLVAGAVAAATTSSQAAAPASLNGKALGLSTDGLTLRVFLLSDPTRETPSGKVTGLEGEDTSLVGIDYRVQDKEFYGVGSAGGVYTIEARTAKATKVSQLTVALSGTTFGVDFNPAADRLRIISDTGQNLRHDVNPGGATTADGALNYTAGTPATGLTAAGYTNNDLSTSTGTLLFDVDISLDQLALQVPPNAGGLTGVGALGAGDVTRGGFDVLSTVRSGATTSNVGYGVFRIGGAAYPSLYKVDLTTGKATRVKAFDRRVADLAVKQP